MYTASLAGCHMTKSTTSTKKAKPGKPYPGFPLWVHPTGRWCRKVKKRFFYFGNAADDPHGTEALKLWLADRDDLMAGQEPRRTTDGLTVADLCNHFLTFKDGLLQSGELAERTFSRYRDNCARAVDSLGRDRAIEDLRTDDFQKLRVSMTKSMGPVALGNEIQMTRSIFRYGYEAGLFDVPIRFGPGFKKPSAKTIRLTRAANGPKMFTPEEINAILGCATPNLRAMFCWPSMAA